MIISGYVQSKDNAFNVASALNHFVEGEIVDQHFKLVVCGDDGVEGEVWIRPLLTQDFMNSADSSLVVKCIAVDGKRVDILLPIFETRRSRPALVLIGESP
ncbi:hypothetical protein KA025_03190 [Candidatus Saccharibacteria bacterium]|nr:hypothetical protein [Candidatus Saccharibacteria bacterium]MBP7835064.1 hypothetical protein [Candidatus Saccharibacteria bacterium]